MNNYIHTYIHFYFFSLKSAVFDVQLSINMASPTCRKVEEIFRLLLSCIAEVHIVDMIFSLNSCFCFFWFFVLNKGCVIFL